MDTSRTQVDRLLDPDNTSVTLHTLYGAAEVLGKRLRVSFEEIDQPAGQTAGRISTPTRLTRLRCGQLVAVCSWRFGGFQHRSAANEAQWIPEHIPLW